MSMLAYVSSYLVQDEKKYQIAKELKKAKYPQRSTENYYLDLDDECPPHSTFEECEVRDERIGKYIANPTLAELIEELGNDFLSLSRPTEKMDIWLASSTGMRIGHQSGAEGGGSTPEEAVANLWIILNGK